MSINIEIYTDTISCNTEEDTIQNIIIKLLENIEEQYNIDKSCADELIDHIDSKIEIFDKTSTHLRKLKKKIRR